MLTIGDRKGEFPGMLGKRRFTVILVGNEKGGNEGKVVDYEGRSVSIKM